MQAVHQQQYQQQAFIPIGGLQQPAIPQYYYPTPYSAFPGAAPLATFDVVAAAAQPPPQLAPPANPRGAGARGRRQTPSGSGGGDGGSQAGGSMGWPPGVSVGALASSSVGLGMLGMDAMGIQGVQGSFVAMTVEDILAVLQALPRGRSAVQAVGHCLGCLDSRCGRARASSSCALRGACLHAAGGHVKTHLGVGLTLCPHHAFEHAHTLRCRLLQIGHVHGSWAFELPPPPCWAGRTFRVLVCLCGHSCVPVRRSLHACVALLKPLLIPAPVLNS
jgi:hypothetical protein